MRFQSPGILGEGSRWEGIRGQRSDWHHHNHHYHHHHHYYHHHKAEAVTSCISLLYSSLKLYINVALHSLIFSHWLPYFVANMPPPSPSTRLLRPFLSLPLCTVSEQEPALRHPVSTPQLPVRGVGGYLRALGRSGVWPQSLLFKRKGILPPSLFHSVPRSPGCSLFLSLTGYSISRLAL